MRHFISSIYINYHLSKRMFVFAEPQFVLVLPDHLLVTLHISFGFVMQNILNTKKMSEVDMN